MPKSILATIPSLHYPFLPSVETTSQVLLLNYSSTMIIIHHNTSQTDIDMYFTINKFAQLYYKLYLYSYNPLGMSWFVLQNRINTFQSSECPHELHRHLASSYVLNSGSVSWTTEKASTNAYYYYYYLLLATENSRSVIADRRCYRNTLYLNFYSMDFLQNRRECSHQRSLTSLSFWSLNICDATAIFVRWSEICHEIRGYISKHSTRIWVFLGVLNILIMPATNSNHFGFILIIKYHSACPELLIKQRMG